MKVSKFELSQLDGFQPTLLPGLEFKDLNEDMERNIANPEIQIASMMRDGKLICIVGIKKLREGVGEAWIIPSGLVRSFRFEFFKTIHLLIIFALTELNYHRLQMAVDLELPNSHKWAEKLGFHYEGIERSYDSTFRDFARFAIIGGL